MVAMLANMTFEQFLADMIAAERGMPPVVTQNIVSNPHTDFYTPHSNYSYSNYLHSDTPHSNYSYSNYQHSNTPHTNYSYNDPRHTNTPHSNCCTNDSCGPHSQGAEHANGWGPPLGSGETTIVRDRHYQAYDCTRGELNVYANVAIAAGDPHVNTYYPYSITRHSNTLAHNNNYAVNVHDQTAAHNNGYTAPAHDNTNAHNNGYYVPAHSDAAGFRTTYYTHSNVGFDHTNYVPSVPRVFNESKAAGIPLRDTATIRLMAYDANLHDGLGTQDAQSRDIFFSLEMRKVSSFNGKAVSAADAVWRAMSPFTQSPLSGGNTITHTPIPSQRADSQGVTIFTINTRNPFGKSGTVDYLDEEGIYELRAVAWNTYRAGNGVTRYYISSTRLETLEFRQNFIPEVTITNESNIRDFVFSNHGAKTTAPAFKRWADDIYSNAYATAQNQTEGIFVRFSMRDRDGDYQWQKGTAYLRRANGTEIARTDVWFSENTSKGSTTVQSDGSWRTGYAYFGNWLFPANTDITDCMMIIEIRDYLNAACTVPVGTYQVVSTTLDIDTKVPSIINVTQTTAGLNTSTVKAGVGITNSVYAIRFRLNAADSHPNTKMRNVQYAVTNTAAFPNNLTTVSVDASGHFTVPPNGITQNGTYYVHVYAQDFAGNEHMATYGPYTRAFEPEFTGIYLTDMTAAGKKTNYGASIVNGLPSLGMPVYDGLKLPYRQGYVFTLRVAGMNADRIELALKCGSAAIPLRFVGYRKFELPDSSNAVVPTLTDAGNISVSVSVVDSIMPSVITDAEGHLVADTNSVYVAEYQVYLHRDTIIQAGTSNDGKSLNLSAKLIGQQSYPAGHPLAGQKVFTDIDINDAFQIDGNATSDGGTNSTN